MKQFAAVLLTAGLIAAIVSWQSVPGKSARTDKDTVPDRERKIRNIDDAIQKLEEAKANLEKSKDNVDWPKIELDMKQSMDLASKIDFEKMNLDLEAAMKQLDTAKLRLNMEQTLASLDMKKIQNEFQDAFKAFDTTKFQLEMQDALDNMKIAMKDQTKQLEKGREELLKQKELFSKDFEKNFQADMEKGLKEMKNMKPNMENAFADARVSLEKSRKELEAYKELINKLDADGLINKNGSYIIDYRKGELKINGKVNNTAKEKYKSYFKDKGFTLKKDADSFDIKGDNNYDREEN